MRALWVVTIFGVLFLWSCTNSNEKPETGNKPDTTASVVDSSRFQPKKVKYDSFGFPYDSSMVSDYKVKWNESLYAILDRFDFSPQQIYTITNKAKKIFDVRSFKPGQNYRVYASADSSRPISRLIWQPRPVDYVVFDWKDSLSIYQKQKEIEVRSVTESAIINSSLYEAMADKNMDPMLAYKLSEIYAWQIDFSDSEKVTVSNCCMRRNLWMASITSLERFWQSVLSIAKKRTVRTNLRVTRWRATLMKMATVYRRPC